MKNEQTKAILPTRGFLMGIFGFIVFLHPPGWIAYPSRVTRSALKTRYDIDKMKT